EPQSPSPAHAASSRSVWHRRPIVPDPVPGPPRGPPDTAGSDHPRAVGPPLSTRPGGRPPAAALPAVAHAPDAPDVPDAPPPGPPPDRYGSRPGRRAARTAALVLALVAAVVAAAWFGLRSTPPIQGHDVAFRVLGDDAVEVTFDVSRTDPARPATCRVEAL